MFPAVRGIQAQREYYVSMCPMRLLPKIFLFNEEELVPELRAQRQLNKARLPELARYITENADNYVFSAITVSVDADVTFEQVAEEGEGSRLGTLHIPMSARFIINDGQHRRAAIDRALREKPELGDESIAVVFFLDLGLARCQQMFADLNRYAIRPSKSLGILYDSRDETAHLIKGLIAQSPVFRNVVELEKTSLAARSRRLFTLSAIYRATEELLNGMDDSNPRELSDLALNFWETVASHMKEWQRVSSGELTAAQVRSEFIYTHGVVLRALARAGRTILQRYPTQWREKLTALEQIDWRRANSHLWEGRALLDGQVLKSDRHVTLIANAIKNHFGLALSPNEQKVEDIFLRGDDGSSKQ